MNSSRGPGRSPGPRLLLFRSREQSTGLGVWQGWSGAWLGRPPRRPTEGTASGGLGCESPAEPRVATLRSKPG